MCNRFFETDFMYFKQGTLLDFPALTSNDDIYRATERKITNAWLITYFDNFVFGFSSLRLRDFLYDVFRLQGKTK